MTLLYGIEEPNKRQFQISKISIVITNTLLHLQCRLVLYLDISKAILTNKIELSLMKMPPIVHLKNSFAFVLSWFHLVNVNKMLYIHKMCLWLIHNWKCFLVFANICMRQMSFWLNQIVHHHFSSLYINFISIQIDFSTGNFHHKLRHSRVTQNVLHVHFPRESV